MTIKKALSDMSKEELIGMLTSIHEALWDPEEFWEKVSWDPDTMESIAEVFTVNILHPADLDEYQDEYQDE